MRSVILWVVIVVLVLVCVPFILGVISFSGLLDKHVTREETVKNFSDHESDIMHFSDLFQANRPANHEIFLSLDGNKGSISIGLPTWAVYEHFPNHHFDFRVSNVDENSAFLKELGWDVSTFSKIVESFRKTNCESAQTDDGYVSIQFKTGTWSSYSYEVDPTPMSDSLRKRFDSLGIQILNKRVTIGRATAL